MPHPDRLLGGRPDTALTVVIPHYGAAEVTVALTEMLTAQEGAPRLQLIVVDDASPESFPDTAGVEVVRRAVNGGFGSAVNSGIEHALHDRVLVLNSDVRMSTHFVADLIVAADPWRPAVVSPRIIDSDGCEAWVGRKFPTTSHQLVEWLTPLARFRDSDVWHRGVGHDVAAHGRTREVDWVIGAAMLLPTADFRAVGGFDERFFMNVDEVDLQQRLRSRGVRSIVLAEPTLTHTGGGSSDPVRRRTWLVESRLAYAEKLGGRAARWRLQAALVAVTALNLAFNTLRRGAGRDVAPFEAARRELELIRTRR